jgi:hypothetical protein
MQICVYIHICTYSTCKHIKVSIDMYINICICIQYTYILIYIYTQRHAVGQPVQFPFFHEDIAKWLAVSLVLYVHICVWMHAWWYMYRYIYRWCMYIYRYVPLLLYISMPMYLCINVHLAQFPFFHEDMGKWLTVMKEYIFVFYKWILNSVFLQTYVHKVYIF